MTQGNITLERQCDEEINNHNELISKTPKKTKITIYLTEQADHALAELYIARYRKDRKIDRSTIACEAIQAFYEKECKGSN